MASCEKCWRDAHGDPDLYGELIAMRSGELQCTPEQQAGGVEATICGYCGRKAVHMICMVCMACGEEGSVARGEHEG